MMGIAELTIWCSLLVIGYAYLGYPAIMYAAARLWKRPVRRAAYCGSLSIVVTAHDEERRIAGRIAELGRLAGATGLESEIIVVSDGSRDATAAAARQAACGCPVRVVELAENVGKAEALNRGVREAKHDVLVFADARQRWADDALQELLANLADPQVGAASGDLVLEEGEGLIAAVGAYWRFEKWLRRRESEVHSTVGATGAICAVRRELFTPIPPRTVLDDVYWPLRVAMRGYRVVHDQRAKAFDRLPQDARGELRRKLRTLSGNFQLLVRLPAAVLPWRNPIALQFISHKVFRLLVPWAMLALMVAPWFTQDAMNRALAWAQLPCYGLALAGTLPAVAKRSRLASAASSLVMLNLSAWAAFWVWLAGRADRSWVKVEYDPSLAGSESDP